MQILKTRRINLRPIEETDLMILHRWRNEPRFLNFCSVRKNLVTFEEFVNEFRYDIEHDRHLQLIIERLSDPIQIVGTLYSYSFNLIDGHCFITIYLDQKYDRRGYGVEATALFLYHLFESYPLNKIYMEVYDYNRSSWSNLEGAGFVLEGGIQGTSLL